MSRRFHDEPRASIVRRRFVTIPRSVATFLVVTVLLPILLAAGAAVDLVRAVLFRRPWMAVRLIAFGWIFLAVETWSLLRLVGHWVMSGFGARREWLVTRAWPVQAWWARVLFVSVQRLFNLDLVVEDADDALPGPIIAMFRHASIIDNLLPAVLLSDQRGLKLRWLIKKELLAVPSLDAGGTRLPNHFVDRSSTDPRAEIRAIRSLAEDLSPDEGVLIFAEGTRFTESRKARALAELAKRDPDLHLRAQRLRHLLPPRLGGPLTLLDTGYDVVFCAHEGLGGFAKVKDMWSGALIGQKITVRFWRIAAAEIPTGRKQRAAWLFDQWLALDDWIESVKSAAAVTLPAG